MIEKDDGTWFWFAREERPPYRITGKYLFFSPNFMVLRRILRAEFERGFGVAKVSKEALDGEHVLCLYYANDARGSELFERYKDEANVKYRWWKSDEATMRGEYSEQHKAALTKRG